ncbi:MAG: hypothetical protein FWC51_03585 [Proteobacteria bacterium]|nr:hypothetical protein [Pseudomonadota bacterium]
MKKSIKLAAMLAVIATPALAENSITNLENPLYIPTAGEVYSKTTAGVMYRAVDDAIPMQALGQAGKSQFPIWRLYEDLGVGITNRLAVRASVAWIQNNPGNRSGLSEGRVGLNYRIFDGSATHGINWDVYADAFLGGVDPMRATLKMPVPGMMALAYDNYSTGQNGVWVGTQVGKTWDKFTGAAYVEFQRTFGNSNNTISVSDPTMAPVFGAMPMIKSLSVDTASTWATGFGFKGSYQISDKCSLGGSITYRAYSDNTITGLHINWDDSKFPAGLPQPMINAIKAGITASLTPAFASYMGNIHDGWTDWTLGLSLARQFTNNVQGVVYAQYTANQAAVNSQDGADAKVEAGLRLNLRF